MPCPCNIDIVSTLSFSDLPLISDYVKYWAQHQPDEEMLTHVETRLTARQVEEQSAALARALMAAGVRHGDRVAVLGDPRPEFYVSFIAAVRIGATWQGLNPKYTDGELDHVTSDSRPSVLLGLSAEDRPKLAALASRVGLSGPIVVAGAEWDEFVRTGESVTDVELQRAERSVLPSDPAVLVYTSGTSGRPKGALLPHRGLVRCSAIQAERWYEARPRMLCDLPINHVGSLGDISSSVVIAGGTVHYMERFDRVGVLEVIASERIEYWLAIPTMFLLASRTPEWAGADLSSMKRAIWGGAAPPRDLVLELQRRIPIVCTSYGMTETVGSVTYTDDDDDLESLLETVGRPDPRYELRIASPDGAVCGVGEAGEIQLRGDYIMLGYLNRPDATREAIDDDGWLHTGDVGSWDDEGRVRLGGRLTDMFKSGGYNVYPREIELAREEHPQVAAASVVSIPDELYWEVGAGFVVAQGDPPTEEQLRAFLRTKLANYKIPKGLFIRAELPRLPIGKVDKRALRAIAEEAVATSSPATATNAAERADA